MIPCILMSALTWILFSVHLSFAVKHKLQYFHTVTSGLNFPQYTDVGLVDGEPFVYYDSKIRKYIPKTEWIKQIIKEDPEYWNSGSQNQQAEEESYKQNEATIKQRFNHTTGVHTLQRMYGCEIEDDGTVRGYDQIGYDGEDFISLDLQTKTWTAAKPQAVMSKNKLDNTGTAAYDQFYLENICIEWLMKYVSIGRETLERKVPPDVSVYQKHSSLDVVCHATGFYPEEVKIFWQKNGEDLIEDVELGETLPNNDGSFQKRSLLKVPVKKLQRNNYTCVVQHSSLEKEILKPVINLKGEESGRLRICIPAAAAAVCCAAGVILGSLIRKKKSASEEEKYENGHSYELGIPDEIIKASLTHTDRVYEKILTR